MLASDASSLGVSVAAIYYSVCFNGPYSNVVNPDQVSASKSNGVSAPNILRVDVGDSNVSM